MSEITVSELVRLVRKSESEEEAISLYSGTRGFSSNWISSVFKSKRELPKLDTLFDVQSVGQITLTKLGVEPSDQAQMFSRWGSLSDDQKAPWVIDWKKLDTDDIQEISAFVNVISVFLSKL